MITRPLGKSQLTTTPLILGTWAIGGLMWGGTEEKDAIAAIHESLDQGINTIDTAPMYGMGKSEELIAKALKGRPHKVNIATKCGLRWDLQEGPSWKLTKLDGKPVTIHQNITPASIFHEWEESRKRLQVDVIDLYQIHWPDDVTPVEEAWQAMVDLKKQGKVRAIGVSNFNLAQLKKAHALHPVDTLQPPYSLARPDIDKDLLPFCELNGISVIVYSPLERGLLTGKIGPDLIFPPGDHRAEKPLFSKDNRRIVLEVLAKIQPIADHHKASLTQIVINTTIHRPSITAALVGARNAAQAHENAAALTLELSPDEQSFITETLGSLHFNMDE